MNLDLAGEVLRLRERLHDLGNALNSRVPIELFELEKKSVEARFTALDARLEVLELKEHDRMVVHRATFGMAPRVLAVVVSLCAVGGFVLTLFRG